MPFSRNVLCTRSSHTCSLLALGISCTTTTLFQSLRLTYRLYFGFDSTRLGAARRDRGRAPRAGDERLCMFFSHLMACSALEIPLRPIKHVPVTPVTNCNEGGWAVKACKGACRNSTAGAPMQQRGSSRQCGPRQSCMLPSLQAQLHHTKRQHKASLAATPPTVPQRAAAAHFSYLTALTALTAAACGSLVQGCACTVNGRKS